MHSERVTFLTTSNFKAALVSRAAAMGLSTGEYIRRKIEDDEEMTPDQEAELIALTAQVNEAVPKMAAALARMSAQAQALHEEMDAFLREKGVRA